MSIFLVLKIFYLFIMVLISLAYLTLLERKILSIVGFRLGPNKVSFMGLAQPLLDGLKISLKQVNVLKNFSFMFYYLSSFFLIFISIVMWTNMPWDPKLLDFKLSFLIFFFFLGFHSLMCMMSAWSSYNKYSMVASLRIVSQLISYEGCLYMIVVFFIYIFFSISFNSVSYFYCFFFFPLLLLFWLVSSLAEMSRSPFDFGESESELVSGFNVEYGSSFFSFIFMSEYSNILLFSFVSSFLFFLGCFFLSFFFFFFFFIWIRSVVPRFRFDSFMFLCWKFMIPFLTLYFCFFFVYCF